MVVSSCPLRPDVEVSVCRALEPFVALQRLPDAMQGLLSGWIPRPTW
jgi:hypothetical protein